MGSIPGLGRSPEERNDSSLQYFAWRIPWTEEPGRLQSMGSQKSQTWLSDWTTINCTSLLGLTKQNATQIIRLKQQKYIFQKFWRLGLVSPEASLSGLQTTVFALCRHLSCTLSVSNICPYGDTDHTGLRLTHRTSLYLPYLFKGISKYSHSLRYRH